MMKKKRAYSSRVSKDKKDINNQIKDTLAHIYDFKKLFTQTKNRMKSGKKTLQFKKANRSAIITQRKAPIFKP